ncbi:MAG: phosphodiester glycosidase family protein [Xenococcaceae cyanobacterium]
MSNLFFRSKHFLKNHFLIAAITGVLILPIVSVGRLYFDRPPQTNALRSLFQGIDYQRIIKSIPRPIVIHIVAIDLQAPGIKVLVTPGKQTADNTELNARTTSAFAREFNLQLAVNGGFFSPFKENTPWNYQPRSGERVNVLGQAISDGLIYSPAEENKIWPVICFRENRTAQINTTGKCPQRTLQGVAGNQMLIDRSKVTNANPEDSKKAYPRTAVGIDRTGKKLWLVVIDGKQPMYSEGVTIGELTQIFQDLNVYSALNLDGGGSTTLVTETASEIQPLNAPIHTKIPMRSRPIANHIGFYAIE